MNIESILKKLGFSDNEVKVYLANLELNQSSAQKIARAAGVPRTTAYSLLEGLVKRGVVAKTLDNNKTRFVAEPPAKLLSTLTTIETELKQALPQLEARYNKGNKKPKILFYEGRAAAQKVYDDTLSEKPDEILEWNTNQYFSFEKYPVDPAYISKRVKLGIKAKRIAGEGSMWDKKHKKYDRSELSETLILPKDKFWPDIEVNIYNNKVAFLNYAEEMSLIIESKAIAEAMRQAYQLSWIGAESIEVNN